MWSLISPDSTNIVTVPQEGIISVTKPDSITVYPYVNNAVSAVHHVHVSMGDQVYFKVKNSETTPVEVAFDYAGTTSKILVAGATSSDSLPAVTESAILATEAKKPKKINPHIRKVHKQRKIL